MDWEYHFSKCSKCTLPSGASESESTSAASGSSFTDILVISATTSSNSAFVGLCPSSNSSCAISSLSRMPSPFLSSLSKTFRTSTAMRASLTVYHFRKSSKASLSSLVRGILFQSLEAASSLIFRISSSEGGVQPSFCMNILNSASLIFPSLSWSISAKACWRDPFISRITAMPAVSVRLACCVRSFTMPLRNFEGILRLTSLCPLGRGAVPSAARGSSHSGATAFLEYLLNQSSKSFFAFPLIVMKPT
mmetsp:Transcript_51433/g.159508  ORF Transcript_51433/g.159508 Transcript_51433/m.159508 type:complete len:249 (-) Transcript_51433:211-957(-)